LLAQERNRLVVRGKRHSLTKGGIWVKGGTQGKTTLSNLGAELICITNPPSTLQHIYREIREMAKEGRGGVSGGGNCMKIWGGKWGDARGKEKVLNVSVNWVSQESVTIKQVKKRARGAT